MNRYLSGLVDAAGKASAGHSYFGPRCQLTQIPCCPLVRTGLATRTLSLQTAVRRLVPRPSVPVVVPQEGGKHLGASEAAGKLSQLRSAKDSKAPSRRKMSSSRRAGGSNVGPHLQAALLVLHTLTLLLHAHGSSTSDDQRSASSTDKHATDILPATLLATRALPPRSTEVVPKPQATPHADPSSPPATSTDTAAALGRRLQGGAIPRNGSLRFFWEHADPAFSHIRYTTYLKSEAVLTASWRRAWLERFAPQLVGARVVEYGIGAALLGEVLLKGYNVSHYTGVDISDRQLEHARARLSANFTPDRYALIRVDELPDLNAFGGAPPTVFISQAVIQHFPSKAYFRRFANRINACPSIKHVMLQIRRKDSNPRMRLEGDTYKEGMDLRNAVTFKEGELLNDFMAPHFRLDWETAGGFTNAYRFYSFTRRDALLC